MNGRQGHAPHMQMVRRRVDNVAPDLARRQNDGSRPTEAKGDNAGGGGNGGSNGNGNGGGSSAPSQTSGGGNNNGNGNGGASSSDWSQPTPTSSSQQWQPTPTSSQNWDNNNNNNGGNGNNWQSPSSSSSQDWNNNGNNDWQQTSSSQDWWQPSSSSTSDNWWSSSSSDNWDNNNNNNGWSSSSSWVDPSPWTSSSSSWTPSTSSSTDASSDTTSSGSTSSSATSSSSTNTASASGIGSADGSADNTKSGAASGGSNKIGAGAIAGIVVGLLALVAIVGAVVFWRKKRSGAAANNREMSQVYDGMDTVYPSGGNDDDEHRNFTTFHDNASTRTSNAGSSPNLADMSGPRFGQQPESYTIPPVPSLPLSPGLDGFTVYNGPRAPSPAAASQAPTYTTFPVPAAAAAMTLPSPRQQQRPLSPIAEPAPVLVPVVSRTRPESALIDDDDASHYDDEEEVYSRAGHHSGSYRRSYQSTGSGRFHYKQDSFDSTNNNNDGSGINRPSSLSYTDALRNNLSRNSAMVYDNPQYPASAVPVPPLPAIREENSFSSNLNRSAAGGGGGGGGVGGGAGVGGVQRLSVNMYSGAYSRENLIVQQADSGGYLDRSRSIGSVNSINENAGPTPYAYGSNANNNNRYLGHY